LGGVVGGNSAGGDSTVGTPDGVIRYLAAVLRDDSCAGSQATMQPSMINPLTVAIVVRDISSPLLAHAGIMAQAGIGQANLAGLADFADSGEL